ncbi:MAG TPA: hypothetical protein VNF47_10865 [Streptosporangiaceae bacterium]|nr:hypothetical protein [Streptosporangiaceae bacterium]
MEALETKLAGLLAYLAEYAREAGMDDIAQGADREAFGLGPGACLPSSVRS